jgi:hypothetical protein
MIFTKSRTTHRVIREQITKAEWQPLSGLETANEELKCQTETGTADLPALENSWKKEQKIWVKITAGLEAASWNRGTRCTDGGIQTREPRPDLPHETEAKP